MSNQMKAVICTRYGSPEVLQIQEVPKPTIKEDEILIRIRTTTVASGDCVIRNGKLPIRLMFGFKRPRNPILGTDFAGDIEAIGAKVMNFKVGDRVVASTGMRFGGHAQYIALPSTKAVIQIPDTISYEEATTFAFGGFAALHYIRKAKLNKGQHLFVYGASGAVGSSMVQIAKIFGAKVTAVCSEKNLHLVASLGADRVLDYTANNFKELLKAEEYDVVFDAVGVIGNISKKSLDLSGKYFSISKGIIRSSVEDLSTLLQMAQEQKLKAVIDHIYPLEQMKEAYARTESGRKRGNVVIQIP
jgi:NADPH:quinone reductase-like Zn-dependent oxidoreductase